MKKILLPIDGSDRSMKSVDLVRTLYDPKEVEIAIVTVKEDYESFIRTEFEPKKVTEENGGDGKVSLAFRSFTESSFVTFKELSKEDINAYVATGETIDKAGAYGIQGKGGALVEKYEGDYNNIVGLPVDTLLKNFPDILKEAIEAEVAEKD